MRVNDEGVMYFASAFYSCKLGLWAWASHGDVFRGHQAQVLFGSNNGIAEAIDVGGFAVTLHWVEAIRLSCTAAVERVAEIIRDVLATRRRG